ncbi:MAG: YdeI family protein [Pyrinomonadaceae bacterium]
MDVNFFTDQYEFRAWLERNHDTAAELIVGFWKVATEKPSMTWSQSVDQALCFGWIDGVRRSLDAQSYTIRFTPRRPKSTWSAVNIKKVEELERKRLMTPAGRAAYSLKRDDQAGIYSYENKPKEFDSQQEKLFKQNEKAWSFFQSQPAGYKRQCIYWVRSAKQENTSRRRLERLIAVSEAGQRL